MDRHIAVPRWLAIAAVALGVAAGSFGIASAASGGGSSSSSTSPSASSAPSVQLINGGGPPAGRPRGHQRSDETVLTGAAKASVEKAALANVPNGTIVRVETDADGHAAYEAHMTKADGTPVTVYVNKQYDVVGVESR